ncbi:MAG: hypothetical protein Q8Q65_00605 [bacterium]|nr:hypothetical protein [bacterium]
MQLSTITQKGQVTIPVEIRKFLQVKANNQVVFVKTANKIELHKAIDIVQLKGSIDTTKKYSDRESDKSVADYLAKDYADKIETS